MLSIVTVLGLVGAEPLAVLGIPSVFTAASRALGWHGLLASEMDVLASRIRFCPQRLLGHTAAKQRHKAY